MSKSIYPWYKKINPIWWLGNANDAVDSFNEDGTPSHPNFHPTKPLWIRKILWACRNPFHNLFFFVIGLEDHTEVVNYGKMFPQPPQKWNIILPWICYKGKKWEWYAGWRTGTSLGFAFRNRDAKAK
jgi:hypothetical protein